MTFDEAPLIVPASIIKRILASLGTPILNAKEDLLLDDDTVKDLFLTPPPCKCTSRTGLWS